MRLIASAVASLVLLGAGMSASQAMTIPASGPSSSPGPVVTAGNTYGGSTTNNTGMGNAFDDAVFFSSLTSFRIDASILSSLTKPSTFKSVTYALYRGVFGSGTQVDNIAAVLSSSKKSAGQMDYASGTLGAGSYYFELSGFTNGPSSVTNSVSFSVSAVPLPGAMPMFGAALLALGGVALMRGRKNSDKIVATV